MKEINFFEKQVSGFIKKRLHSNKNFLCFVVGETGSGKSSAAIRLASIVDKNFNTDKIVFKPLDFLELVNKVERYSAIVFDEAGVGIPAREWQSIQNKILGYVGQLFRHRNLAVFFTVPSLDFVDKQIRSLTHTIIHIKGWNDKEQTYGKFLRYKHNPVFPHLSNFAYLSTPNGDLDPVYFEMPSSLIWSKYLRKKDEFASEFYMEAYENVKSGNISNGIVDGRTVRMLRNVHSAFISLVNNLSDKGYSKSDIARMCGCSLPTLTNWLRAEERLKTLEN